MLYKCQLTSASSHAASQLFMCFRFARDAFSLTAVSVVVISVVVDVAVDVVVVVVVVSHSESR